MEISKAKDSSKAQTNKTTYMSDEASADLERALEDALAFERGERRGLKVTRIQGSRPPKALSKIVIHQKRNQSHP